MQGKDLLICAAISVTLLASCGGDGEDGSGGGIDGGQSPDPVIVDLPVL